MNPNDLPFSLHIANELCHSLPLITSPQSISKILATVELCREEERVTFLQELVGLLSKCSCNQLALIQKNLPASQKSPEDFEFRESTETTLEKVYELLSSPISLCRKEGDATRKALTLQTAAELLQLLSQRHIPANEPLRAGCDHTPEDALAFRRGFTVMMVVKPDAPGVLSGSSQALFKFCTSDAIIECGLKDYNVMYFVKSNTIGKLPKDQWVFLSISHNENSCFSVFLDFEERQYTVEYPKFSEDAEFVEEIFFSDFLGMANSATPAFQEAFASMCGDASA
eukprot:TRINITY_DN3230_c0_g1_i4.p1 TRINITY_DN3230_c0_g1~~TRINITY_DN3230_c0_g1_i4.p1  ORF type:complete len:284 (-),score=45.75 TRINITY_DN3230_c0_g1_i4:755-1606(-)